jgi:hypothetical protein
MLEEFANIIEKLGNLAPQLAMMLIMVGLYIFLVKRDDKQQERYDRKDTAYIEALAAIHNSVVRLEQDSKTNWEITRNISEVTRNTSLVVSDSAKALSSLRCLQKNQ